MIEGKKTFIGVFVIFVTLILRDEISETESTQLATALFEVVGLIIVIYGRYKAKKVY